LAESLILFHLNKKKAVLDYLIKGLKALDVLDFIRKQPQLFEPLFVNGNSTELNPLKIMGILAFDDPDDHPSQEFLLRYIGNCSQDGMYYIT